MLQPLSRLQARPRRIIGIGFIILVVILLGVAVFWRGEVPPRPLVLVISIVVGLLMTAIPVAICHVQTDSRRRQLDKLSRVADGTLARTAYHASARRTLEATAPSEFGPDYIVPMALFSLVIVFGSVVALTVFFFYEQLGQPSVLLGGMLAASYDETAEGAAKALFHYQKGTLVVISASFLGSYVSTLYRLLDRMGNNDLYPISFHYFAARFVIALISAATTRHLFAGSDAIQDAQFLFVVGFVVGLAPDLFLLSMSRRVFLWLQAFGYKSDPDNATWPRSLPLRMIDDLNNDKIDRLGELGIDSAQALAYQNPLLIWTKLPYDLGLLVSWIAQAQLYCLLREAAIRDIFDLQAGLADAEARPVLLGLLGVDPARGAPFLAAIEENQAFARLREVRDALRGGAAPA
jgi:hypothetical protein